MGKRSINWKGIIVLVSFFLCADLMATTYYISNSGNDGNSGTSQASPWATISKVNSITLHAGDFVLFQAGGTWRDELNIIPGSSGAGNRIYYGRYGTGANPRILGSNQASNWTATAVANVWQSATTIANPRSGGWGYPGQVFFVTNDSTSWGVYQTYNASFSYLTEEFDWTWSGSRLYVYSPTDPDARYGSVEAAQRDLCAGFVTTASSYIEVNGIDLHYSKRAGYGIQTYPQAPNQTDVTFRNCNIGYIGEKGGACAYGIEAFQSNFLVEHCTITDCGRRGISFNLYESTVEQPCNISNVIIRYNVFKRGYHTTSLDIATAALDPGHSIQNIYYYGNIVDDHEIKMTGDDAGSNQVYFQPYASYFNNMYIVNNVFISATARNVLVTGGDNLYIYNNTVFDHNHNITVAPYGNVSIVRDVNARVNNNIIYDALPANTAIDNWCIISDTPNGDGTLVNFSNLDYNLYYHQVQTDGDRGFFGGTPWGFYRMSGWSTYRSEYPAFDAHSPTPAEPQFTNKANYNLTLTASSPATNRGVVLPYITVTDAHGKIDTINKYDYNRKLRSRTTPSIGAYEYATPSPKDANITSFSMAAQSGAATINSTSHTISLQVVSGTSLISLTPTIEVSPGATISPASGVARNFTSPVTYTVTSQDGTVSQVWTVTVTVATSAAKDITSFAIAGQTGSSVINTTSHTVSVTMPSGTNAASLTPTIGVSQYASISPASGVARNFSSAVTYTVTAQNGTTQVWTVTVTVNRSSAKNITGFTIPGQNGSSVINATNHTVTVSMPNGTNLSSLTPTITVSPFATVSPASGVAQNFTSSVNYTVTAENGTTQLWTVTVSSVTSSDANILSFSISGQSGSSIINATSHTIAVTMPAGSSVTSLTPTITVSPFAAVNPVSGVARDFTNPVNYTVTAQNGSTQVIWTVTVTVSSIENNLPVINVENQSNLYKGLVYTIDASGSYDLDNEALTFNWNVPAEIAVSATTGPIISILPTENSKDQVYTIGLSVSDGKATVNNSINLGINEFDPNAHQLKIMSIQASDYEPGNEPENIIDGDENTRWSANGDEQWLQFELESVSNLSHFELSFHNGENRVAYFDVFASTDGKNWDILLEHSTSCGFSPNMHAYANPETKASNSYKYVKLVGHMNSVNEWNSYGEFKVFGTEESPNATNEANIEDIVEVFPNPATENVFVKTADESTIRVIDITGKVVYEQKSAGDVSQLDFNFQSGTYFIQVLNNGEAVCTKKLLVR